MKSYKVKELMVSLSKYATVDETATLFEAVLALEKAQATYQGTKYPHRAILVIGANGQVLGKVSQMDVLRALEPKYAEMQETSNLAMYGFSSKFIKSLVNYYNLWDSPLTDLCKKAGEISVTKFMRKPTEGEYIEESASLDEAIHQLVCGYHQSLIVTKDDKITGILRLTDVFDSVCTAMKTCGLNA
ncbi:MAG: CBS domain-containing protein [Desulfamplus sp.]|nr:CBS domain-containing protein [Desulfamplus sp.]MBF0411459.1 CBS domain-containing protein [Desulfamplus sp.]